MEKFPKYLTYDEQKSQIEEAKQKGFNEVRYFSHDNLNTENNHYTKLVNGLKNEGAEFIVLLGPTHYIVLFKPNPVEDLKETISAKVDEVLS